MENIWMLMGNVIGASIEKLDDQAFEARVREIPSLPLYFY